MRILASNPDTIGDMVLREPLYRSLREAGHELLLIVRPSVAPLVPYVAPGAQVLVLPAEVYQDAVGKSWEPFADVLRAARAFRPEFLLVAPYQWTQFEEKLAEELKDLPGLRRAGMSGGLYAGDPRSGYTPISRLTFDIRVAVDENLPEVEKNAALAASVRGSLLEQIDPKLEPDPAAVEAGRGILNRLGLTEGQFWIACVTGTVNVPIKAWPVEKWGRLLGDWAARYGRRFLFIGLPQEKAVAEEVRRHMADRAGDGVVWMEGGSIDELIALSSLAAGYVGHDTGPMHVAAATGKPVLAVFGGGHRLRFLPQVTPSVSLTVDVACAGCGWACSFETSHCVKDIPLEAVAQAASDLEANRISGREARALRPPTELQSRMIVEGAYFAQEQLRRASGLERELGERVVVHARDMEATRNELKRRVALYETELNGRDAAAAELNREIARVSREAAGLVEQLNDRESAVAQLREDVANLRRESDQRQAEVMGRTSQVISLREQVRQLNWQIQVTSGPATRAARTWRQLLADWFVGKRQYVPRRPPLPLPKITLAIPVDQITSVDASLHATIDSIHALRYPRLDLVLAVAGAENDATAAAAGFVDEVFEEPPRIAASNEGSIAALAKAFETSDADVIGWIEPGDVLEAGGLQIVGEFFQDRPRAQAAFFEETADLGGWRVPRRVSPHLDVYTLLADDTAPRGGVFFRQRAYSLLGGIKADKGPAAGWDLLIRFARRHGLERGRGHVLCRPAALNGQVAKPSEQWQAARKTFDETFGPAGRIRCRMIQALNQLTVHFQPLLNRRRLDFGPAARDAMPIEMPAGQAEGPPVSPVSGRPPDRLLFTARDTSTADRQPRPVFYDSTGDAALAYPPIDGDELAALYAARAAARGQGIVAPAGASAYAGYRGGRAWEKSLLRLPSPYWRFFKPEKGDQTGKRMLSLLRGLVRRDDPKVRLLNVSCFEGRLLDQVKSATKWQTAGTETNERAAAIARKRGHVVWESSPQDSTMIIPIGESFDVIVLSGVMEHLADPLMILRRLRQLLRPGGLIALDQPNLDSKLAEWFGPTWAGWQAPYHRVLTGRRGIRQLARQCDLKLRRLRTYTDPYPASVSAAINELGLAATVPEGAPLPPTAGRQGAQIAGWTRMLWDWRGKGDQMYVVMRSV